MQLTLAAGDGVAVQAGDPCQQRDAPMAMLAGEEADKESSAPFVRGGHEAVDNTVLLGRRAVGPLLANRALTAMDGG